MTTAAAKHPKDFALLQRVSAGDEAAASEVMQSLGGEMFGFARRMLADEQAAEDALQEALLGLLRTAGNFDGRESLRTWVFRILRNKIIDQYRKRGRDLVVSDADPEAASFSSSGHWKNLDFQPWNESAELLEVVQHCMELLPHNQREALQLKAIEELSAQEASEILGVSVANFRQILHRGRASVRKCADDKIGGSAA